MKFNNVIGKAADVVVDVLCDEANCTNVNLDRDRKTNNKIWGVELNVYFKMNAKFAREMRKFICYSVVN